MFSGGLHGPSLIAAAYEPLIVGRPAFISFQTAAEIRFGAALRTWGATRLLKMETRLGSAEIVHTGPELIETYTRLRVDCHHAGHALAQAHHDAVAGSPQPPFAWGSRSSRTTASSPVLLA